jgi:hypothetical protein
MEAFMRTILVAILALSNLSQAETLRQTITNKQCQYNTFEAIKDASGDYTFRVCENGNDGKCRNLEPKRGMSLKEISEQQEVVADASLFFMGLSAVPLVGSVPGALAKIRNFLNASKSTKPLILMSELRPSMQLRPLTPKEIASMEKLYADLTRNLSFEWITPGTYQVLPSGFEKVVVGIEKASPGVARVGAVSGPSGLMTLVDMGYLAKANGFLFAKSFIGLGNSASGDTCIDQEIAGLEDGIRGYVDAKEARATTIPSEMSGYVESLRQASGLQ